jgi:hypothetical protein
VLLNDELGLVSRALQHGESSVARLMPGIEGARRVLGR